MYTEKEIKRRLRRLKALERLIRFGPEGEGDEALLWDRFFDLHKEPMGKAKYSLGDLCQMRPVELEQAESAFLYGVCRLAGQGDVLYDAGALDCMGLAPDADRAQVKKRFRELALRLHPDVGGEEAAFRELVAAYRKLTGSGGI